MAVKDTVATYGFLYEISSIQDSNQDNLGSSPKYAKYSVTYTINTPLGPSRPTMWIKCDSIGISSNNSNGNVA